MDKIAELKSVLGKDCSCNQSSTNRAKVIKVGSRSCILEVTPAHWASLEVYNTVVGRRFTLPTYIVHNMYFF